jgi:hypothetical protein
MGEVWLKVIRKSQEGNEIMKRKLLLGFFCIVILLCFIFTFMRPMIIQVSKGPLAPFAIPNPFRDRNPERVARQFLANLKTEKCRDLLVSLGYEEKAELFCLKESKVVPDSYRMLLRTDSANSVRLIFRWSVINPGNYQGICLVDLKKEGTSWRVSTYEREY